MSAAAGSSRAESLPPDREQRDVQSLASSLAPVLRECCGQRLRDIRWFRADWQRGGAATGRAVFHDEQRGPVPVIVKIPVGHTELRWTQRLQSGSDDQVVPRLFAGDDHLAGYDLGWIVIEAIPHGPLGARWSETTIPRIADAAARFYAATANVPFDRGPATDKWEELVHQSRESIHTNAILDRQRWAAALKIVQARLDRLIELWAQRTVTCWLHGDLHPANAMCRREGDDAPVTLIDLSEIHPGHWIEDAIFLERLHWNRSERIKRYKPVRELARAMRAQGLPVDDGYHRLACIRRILLAATAPRFMKTEGSAAHLHACIERLESSLQELTASGL